MQRLADAGMIFTRAYVASPSCAPSRAALLPGLMSARNGAEPNHSKPRPEIKKWPAYFRELGYEVVAFGKVPHYGHAADYGFDHFAFDGFHQHQAIPAAVEFRKNRPMAEPELVVALRQVQAHQELHDWGAGGDFGDHKASHREEVVAGCWEGDIAPHVACNQNANVPGLDGARPPEPVYPLSQSIRKRVEETPIITIEVRACIFG